MNKLLVTPSGVLALAGLAFALTAVCGPAAATGTVIVQQSDGSTKTYRDVTIRIRSAEMSLTSSDG